MRSPSILLKKNGPHHQTARNVSGAFRAHRDDTDTSRDRTFEKACGSPSAAIIAVGSSHPTRGAVTIPRTIDAIRSPLALLLPCPPYKNPTIRDFVPIRAHLSQFPWPVNQQFLIPVHIPGYRDNHASTSKPVPPLPRFSWWRQAVRALTGTTGSEPKLWVPEAHERAGGIPSGKARGNFQQGSLIWNRIPYIGNKSRIAADMPKSWR